MSENIAKAARGRVGATSYNRTRALVLCALFCALIAVGAFIKVPVPVVPFTLQFLFTTLAGLLLGPKWGLISVVSYVALGLVGLPIFAGGGGIGYLAQPSFGYLLGFCGGTYLTARIAGSATHPSTKRLLAACFAGLGVVYVVGMVYFYLISNFIIGAPLSLGALVLYCFVLAVPGDIAICFACIALTKRLKPLAEKGSYRG